MNNHSNFSNLIHRCISCIIILSSIISLHGQEDKSYELIKLKSNYDAKYGEDARLINGIKYDNPYYGYEGTPFFFNTSVLGTVNIEGIEFEKQKLRFDIINNQLILDHQSDLGSESIILPNSKLKYFSLGNIQFKKITIQEEQQYAQIVYEGNLKCYFIWSKELKLESISSGHTYYFTEPSWKGYVFLNDRKHEFRSKHTFIKIFQKEHRKTIKKYIKHNKIKIKQSRINDLSDLLFFCEQII